MSVHVHGRIGIVKDDELRGSLKRMTNHHERISAHPFSPEVLESEIEKQIIGIVGFEIQIERIEASYKMSQNRSTQDYENIIRELQRLEDYNARMVAKKMREIRRIE